MPRRRATLLLCSLLAAFVHELHAAAGNWGFRRRPRVAILTLADGVGADWPSATWQQDFPTLQLSVAAAGEASNDPPRNESGHWVARVVAGAPQRGLYAGLEHAARLFFNVSDQGSVQEWLLVVEGARADFFMETLLKQLDMFANVVGHQVLLTDALSPTPRSLGCAAPAPCRSYLTCVRPESKLPPLGGCQRPAEVPCTRDSVLGAVCRDSPLDKNLSAAAVPCLSAGVLLSRGLVLTFASSDRREPCAEADADVFACLGDRVAVTDPGMYSESDFCAFGFTRGDEVVATAEKAQTALACDEGCQRALHDTVSAYVGDEGDAAAAARLLSLPEQVLSDLKQASVNQLMRNLEQARAHVLAQLRRCVMKSVARPHRVRCRARRRTRRSSSTTSQRAT